MTFQRYLPGLTLIGIVAGCGGTEPMAGSGSADVESRAVTQMQRPMKSGIPAQPGAAAQANMQMPTWPQKWDVSNREPYGVAFGVTQPGPVTVDVQSQGAPVVVSLLGATPQPIQQQTGSGVIRLTYHVTSADVQRSALWYVRIALTQPGGPPAQAAGTINIQHPPADVNVLRTQMQTHMAQRSAQNPQAEAAMKAQLDASFQVELAKFQQEQTARRAAISAELQPHLQKARARMQGQIKTRAVEGGEESAPPATPTEEEVATRGLGPAILAQPGGTTILGPVLKELKAPPYIIWISRANAQPGDELMITGNDFGEQSPGNKLTMILGADGSPYGGAAVTLIPTILEWHDWYIRFTVPADASGIMRARGVEWTVTRGSDGVSSAQPQGLGFQFYPAIDLRKLPLPPPWGESVVQAPATCLAQLSFTPTGQGCASDLSVPHGWFRVGSGAWKVFSSRADWLGYRGNDRFFLNKKLKNGWKVTKANIDYMNRHTPDDHVWCLTLAQSGNAYVANSRVGTDSPYIDIRVWLDPYCAISYSLDIWIQGPRGVPYE